MASSSFTSSNPAAVRFATVSIGLFSYFLLALLVLHFVRPDYTVVDHMISDYAVGQSGWIMTTAFLGASFGCLTLMISLFLAGPASWLGRIGAALLFVAFVGLIVTAIFPTDLETAPSTPTGDIHTMSFLANIVSIVLSGICLGLSYGGSAQWRRYRGPALIFVLLLIAAFLAQFFTLHRGAPYGVTNRVFVLVLMAWLISNGFWVRAVAGRAR